MCVAPLTVTTMLLTSVWIRHTVFIIMCFAVCSEIHLNYLGPCTIHNEADSCFFSLCVFEDWNRFLRSAHRVSAGLTVECWVSKGWHFILYLSASGGIILKEVGIHSCLPDMWRTIVVQWLKNLIQSAWKEVEIRFLHSCHSRPNVEEKSSG
jgi:hypothetical protein